MIMGQTLGQRPPIHVTVPAQNDVSMDPRTRLVTFRGSNPILMDSYLVHIPACTLKQILGEVIKAEGMHELSQLAARE